jgi:hypothetical protein
VSSIYIILVICFGSVYTTIKTPKQQYKHIPQSVEVTSFSHEDVPEAGALLRAALVASCLRGALPPVDLRAVCLVRAILLYILYSRRLH